MGRNGQIAGCAGVERYPGRVAKDVPDREHERVGVRVSVHRLQWSPGQPSVSDVEARAATVGVIRYDIAARRLDLDDRAREIFSAPTDRPAMEVWHERVHPDDERVVQKMFEDAHTSLGAECLYRIVLPDRSLRYVLTRSMTIESTNDPGAGVLTGIVLAVDPELGADAILTRVLDRVSLGFMVLGEDMVVRYINTESERHLGVPRAEILGRHIHDALPRTRDSFFGDFHREVIATRGEVTLQTASLYVPGRTIELTGSFVDGHVAINFRDVTETVERTARLVDAYQSILDRSRHDDLTGVLNRSALLERLTRPDGDLAAPTALLFVDVDYFKEINDTHGHAAGDLVLRTLAQRLRSECGSEDVIGRIGGDEFIIASFAPTGAGGEQGADRLAARLGDRVREPIALDESDVEVSVTIGIAYNSGTVRLADLLALADTALYSAKRTRPARRG